MICSVDTKMQCAYITTVGLFSQTVVGAICTTCTLGTNFEVMEIKDSPMIQGSRSDMHPLVACLYDISTHKRAPARHRVGLNPMMCNRFISDKRKMRVLKQST
jgi:hypothetical protein